MSIATACPAAPNPRRRKPVPAWNKIFLAMLPQIVAHARVCFRHLRGEARQDAIQETMANALVAFVGLVGRGKMSIAYPTVLARYAVAQINDGRHRQVAGSDFDRRGGAETHQMAVGPGGAGG